MSPRPRFTSRLDTIRNAAVSVLLRPVRWFSPRTQFVLGFLFLVISTTLLLSRWPVRLRELALPLVVTGAYYIAWRFASYRTSTVDLLISGPRAFALIGSAILFQTAVIRIAYLIATAVAAQSTRSPFNDISVWSLAIPFAAASLLITMVLDRQLSLLVAVLTSAFAALLAANAAWLGLYAFIGCATAIYGVGRYRERQSITLAGLVVAAVNCVAAIVLTIFTLRPLSASSILLAGCFGIGGGLLTIVFASGGLPINESLFGVLTDIRLLELSNADLPILSQLALRAPGTNQHSHAVGQLAEDACRAIGANPLLARVGALYHDIGKIAAPDHFVENQTGENPHDRLKPIQSAKIITSHVTFGLRLAKEIGLPKRVTDFIPQHHGTRTLHFFLKKAEAQANGAKIDESDFRYPGPKPQFKEAAILMLVDSAEAAARSLAHPNLQNLSTIVAKIFEAVVSDGQLDESKLTLRDLGEVREAIVNSLAAIYHPRIDYPDFNPPGTIPSREASVHITYERAADVPINRSGEVEEEAVSRDRNLNR